MIVGSTPPLKIPMCVRQPPTHKPRHPPLAHLPPSVLLVGSGVYHLHHDLPRRHSLLRQLLRKALRHLLRSYRPHLRLSHLDLHGITEFHHMVYNRV